MSGDGGRKHWIGFDLGGTKMLALVLNEAFEKIARKRKKTKAHEGSEAGLGRIVRTIEGALGEAGLNKDELCGIGIGSPGPLDLKRGMILDTPNLGWRNVPLKATVEEAFGCPVVVANDVDAGTYGEYRLGAGKQARCVVGIFPGTGIGGGCVYDGRLIQGHTNSFMEIGHIPIQPGGPLCGCGRHGCLESVASRLVVSASAAAAAHRGDAPHLHEAAGTDLADIRSGALAAAIQAGDTVVEQIVRESARWVGRAAATAVNLLGPDIVVLGGGLVEAMPELYREEVAATARSLVMPSFEDSFEVAVATLGDDATALGAAAWAERSLRSAAV